MRKSYFAALTIIFFSFACAIYFYPLMPLKMASHWGITGEADGWSGRLFGVFFMPILSLFLFHLFVFLPKIDPLKKNVKKFEKFFDWFVIGILAFLLYLYLLTLAWNWGGRFNFILAILPAFIILFYLAGVLMEKSRRNYFIGFRTPWALTSDRNWEETNKMGGRLFKIAALIGILGMFFQAQAFLFLIGPLIIFTIYIFIYSYLKFKPK